MAIDLRTTQEYLNDKAGTVGLSKQQCLQRLAGPAGSLISNPMTAQDAARNYAGSGPGGYDRSTSQSIKHKAGASGSDVDITGQEAARRI